MKLHNMNFKKKSSYVIFLILICLFVTLKGITNSQNQNLFVNAKTSINDNILETIRGSEIAIHNDYLIISNGSTFFVLDNIEDSTQISILFRYKLIPNIIGGYDSNYIDDFYISDNYLFIKHKYHSWAYCWQHELVIFDIFNTTEPVLVYQSQNYSWIGDLQKQSNFLYITQSNGIEIMDLSNITSPKSIGIFFDIHFWKIKIINNYAYLFKSGVSWSDTPCMIYVCDISNPYSPKLLNYTLSLELISIYDVHFFQIDNDYLYLLGTYLWTFNIEVPEEPIIIGKWNSSINSPRTMTISNNILYILNIVPTTTEIYSEVCIVNLKTSIIPELVEKRKIDDICWGIGVYNNYIFTTGRNNGVIILLIDEHEVGLKFIPIIVLGLFGFYYMKRKMKKK